MSLITQKAAIKPQVDHTDMMQPFDLSQTFSPPFETKTWLPPPVTESTQVPQPNIQGPFAYMKNGSCLGHPLTCCINFLKLYMWV